MPFDRFVKFLIRESKRDRTPASIAGHKGKEREKAEKSGPDKKKDVVPRKKQKQNR